MPTITTIGLDLAKKVATATSACLLGSDQCTIGMSDTGGHPMVVVLHEQFETECASARVEGEQLWIDAGEFQTTTGWSLKPEGFCRGDTCVPVPPGRAHEFVAGSAVNAAAFWDRMANPVVHDAAREVWVLGTSAGDRSTSLQSLEAPDFSLPDLGGRARTLSEHRGKKVLLATWASW